MITTLTIYIRAYFIYAVITLPALVFPLMYLLSLGYAFIFGWFAWLLFSLIHLVTGTFSPAHQYRLLILSIAVPVAVAFAFQMIEMFDAYDNVWQSGVFLLFPLAATIAGWVSLGISEKQSQAVQQVEINPSTESKVYENE